MRITAESTEKIVHVNGVLARVWEATTADGVECYLFVTRVAVKRDADNAQFERELIEHKPPSVEAADFPARMIL